MNLGLTIAGIVISVVIAGAVASLVMAAIAFVGDFQRDNDEQH